MSIQPTPAPSGFRFTGWHMTAILISFFAVVVGVNLYMARNAVSTFGGKVVENSYVASQQFNGWLAADRAQAALGWTVAATRMADGRVEVASSGPGAGAVLAGEARHPLGHLPDQALQFMANGKGGFVSRQVLANGRWTLRLQLAEGDTIWRGELPLR